MIVKLPLFRSPVRSGEGGKNMKNFRVIVPVFVCLVFSFYVIGCGNATGGGGGGGGSSGKSGKLVDPYITGAIVYVDSNNSGSWDAGEPTAETNSSGQFTFTEAPSLGATIRILVQGTHLGVTYDANLSCSVDGSGILNITPLTTMISNGISAESIVYILSHYAAITMDASDLKDDPMAGLVLANTASIAKIRGAICAYALIQIISSEGGANGFFDLASIEGSTDIKSALYYMGEAVKGALSDDMLTTINDELHDAAVSVEAILPDISPAVWHVSFPKATASDIANSAFAITRYVIAKAIANSGSGYNPNVNPSDISDLGFDVGIRYYSIRNLNHNAITTTPSIPEFPPMTWYDLIVSGEVMDTNGSLSSFEVNSSSEAFTVNDNGTIEVVWEP
jgi:hypothetical protein